MKKPEECYHYGIVPFVRGRTTDIIRRCGLAIVIGFLLMIVLPVSAGQTCSPPNCDSYVGEQSNNVAYDINIVGDSSHLYDNSYYSNSSAAESFIPQKSNLDGVLIWLQKKGTSVTIPTSNVTVYIETSSGGFPTGNILAYSNISTDSISTSRAWYYFKLNQSLSLTVGTTYQIVFVGQYNGTDGIYFYYYSPIRNADSYSNGSYSYNFGSGWVNLPSMDIYLKTVTNEKGLFQLRQFPYNYSAVLSISSDIDESDISSFVNLHDWMNTNKSNTRYGHGLNLDISDSMWFYKKPLNYNSGTPLHQLSYFDNLTSNYSVDKPIIKQYIDAGYIDTLHSYGDFSNSYSPNITQDNINSAVNEINNNSYILDVWINHGDSYNTQNIYNTDTFGDVVGQPEYHWNRTKNFTHYIWKSDITGTLNSLDINTWSLTVSNKVSNPFLLPISIVTLRDGSSAWYFYRAGTWGNADFNDLSISLSMPNLNNLVSNNGWSIIYTHYGADKIPTSDTISVMTNLSNYSNNGTIWVTPSKKQLRYAEVLGFVNWNVTSVGSQNHINIINITNTLRTFVPTVNDLQGLTFYTLDPTNTSIWLNGTRLNTTITGGDPADIYNRSRITINISSLVYPFITMPFYTGINMVVYPDSSIDYQNDYNSNIFATNTSVITPSSDNITINISIWNTTGDYRKVWNESSTNHSVTTQHKIGNFQANTNILIKKNGIAWNTYTSNSTGYISFNYVDGYSSNIQFDASLASSIPSGPYIAAFAPTSPVYNIAGASRTFNIIVNQNVNVTWYLNDTQVGFNEGVTDASYTNSSASEGFWNVTAIATNTSTGLSASQTWDWYVTTPPLPLGAPNITSFAPPSTVSDTTGATRTFNITANQTVNVTWYINGTQVQFNETVIDTKYTNASAAQGAWNISAVATDANGSAIQTWIWTVFNMTAVPLISFTDPTPANGTILTQDYAYINTTVSGTNTTAFIDWNSSLVGWWRFNEENNENSSFFRDWSSWGNNGNCSGTSCPTPKSGKFGNALGFDGLNDYVEVPGSSSLNPSRITVETWFNAASGTLIDQKSLVQKPYIGHTYPYYQYMLSLIDDGSAYTREAAFYITINGVLYVVGAKNLNYGYGQWHYLAGTYNGSNVALYLDGALVATEAVSGTLDSYNTVLQFGAYPNLDKTSTYAFSGKIDEIRIHSRALSPGEIKASYNAGIYRLYGNFTNLTEGVYNYKAHAQDLLGNVNQTEIRTLVISNAPQN